MKFKYPRVSEILEPYSNITLSQIPKEYLESAARRGTAVHSLCVAYARGDFVPEVSDEYTPYFDSFTQWYKENVIELILSEERIYDDNYKFCGQPDLVVKVKDSEYLVLVDLKTSSAVYPIHYVQLAAYDHLVEEVKDIYCGKNIILKLEKTGKIAKKYLSSNDNYYWDTFHKALDLYDFFLRKGGKNDKS